MKFTTALAIIGTASALDSDTVVMVNNVVCDGTALGADLFSASMTATACQAKCKEVSADSANTAKILCCQMGSTDADAAGTASDWALASCQGYTATSYFTTA